MEPSLNVLTRLGFSPDSSPLMSANALDGSQNFWMLVMIFRCAPKQMKIRLKPNSSSFYMGVNLRFGPYIVISIGFIDVLAHLEVGK